MPDVDSTFWTGPLSVCAYLGLDGERDPGCETIILLGQAVLVENRHHAKHRVRMEMSLEEAEDLFQALGRMIKSARKKRS